MINLTNVYTEFYALAIILAILFFMFCNVSTNSLLAVIIILLIFYASYLYLQQVSNDKTFSLKYIKNTLDNDIKDRQETNEKIFYIDKFPTKMKYVKKSQELITIANNIRFTIKFNKTRYSDILLNMDKLMKIYIYILSDRYDAVIYIPMFTDIADNIIEIMYSLFMIIPMTLKHTYGFEPYKEIYKSIDQFKEYKSKMLNVIEKYAVIKKNKVYVPDSTYKAHNSITSFYP
jgi:hypothetical protein